MAGEASLAAGWIAVAFGVLSGALIGLFFRDERFLGGYGTFPRRLLRLGHIAFFGLGFLNILYGLTLRAVAIPPSYAAIATIGLILGLATMSACCFLAAWKPASAPLFVVPVASTAVGLAAFLLGWWLA